jgi:hypothetical protein
VPRNPAAPVNGVTMAIFRVLLQLTLCDFAADFGPPVAVLAAIAAAIAAMTANPMPFFICTSSSGFLVVSAAWGTAKANDESLPDPGRCQ